MSDTSTTPTKANPPIAVQPVLKSKTAKITYGAILLAFVSMIPDIQHALGSAAPLFSAQVQAVLLKVSAILGFVATLYGRLATKQAANESGPP